VATKFSPEAIIRILERSEKRSWPKLAHWNLIEHGWRRTINNEFTYVISAHAMSGVHIKLEEARKYWTSGKITWQFIRDKELKALKQLADFYRESADAIEKVIKET